MLTTALVSINIMSVVMVSIWIKKGILMMKAVEKYGQELYRHLTPTNDLK